MEIFVRQVAGPPAAETAIQRGRSIRHGRMPAHRHERALSRSRRASGMWTALVASPGMVYVVIAGQRRGVGDGHRVDFHFNV